MTFYVERLYVFKTCEPFYYFEVNCNNIDLFQFEFFYSSNKLNVYRTSVKATSKLPINGSLPSLMYISN